MSGLTLASTAGEHMTRHSRVNDIWYVMVRYIAAALSSASVALIST